MGPPGQEGGRLQEEEEVECSLRCGIVRRGGTEAAGEDAEEVAGGLEAGAALSRGAAPSAGRCRRSVPHTTR